MNKQKFLDILKSRILIMDGATGTELQKKKYLDGVEIPEEINIKFPERIADIYSSYINAGSDIILANTFGANLIRLKQHGLLDKADDIIKSGIDLIREISSDTIVAGDISSIGEYIEPLGSLTFDEAYNSFAFQVSLLQKHGADVIVIETMTEIKETKAAILAAKENFDGAIIVQMTFSKDGVTVTGTDLKSFIAMAESLGVDALGLNCSIGSRELAELAKVLCVNTNLPISFKPNAGIPVLINRETCFPETKEEFIEASLKAYSYGVNMFGGCCGTNPEFIKILSGELMNKAPKIRSVKSKYFLSTRTKTIDINEAEKPVIIGERINPTNRKKFQAELLKDNLSTVKDEARSQVWSGANLLDVNMGVPGTDEIKLLINAVNQIQETVSVPLCIDSSNSGALEQAVKNCAGRPLINSVNGEQAKLDVILPIAKRYGAALIALTTDDNGIPATAEKRLKIAAKILNFADRCGLERKNIVFDYLVLSASSSPDQIGETLKAMRESKRMYPECKLVLGVSNVSFGLPSRQTINSTFLKMAVAVGLDFAIANPHENWDIDDPFAKNLLENKDKGAVKYMEVFTSFRKQIPETETEKLTTDKQLYFAILNGNRDSVDDILSQIIASGDSNPFRTVNNNVLKALNVVGEKFASKEYFLPQIIMSAQAAQSAFAIVKATLKKDEASSAGKIIIATVKGDMHDIGKNIVGAVLESYGFDVIDMGVNVDSQSIIDEAHKINPIAIGLSALMTTTMPEMEMVVKLKNAARVPTKIIVGGAAVTEKFAKEIGADAYARDAMEAAGYVKTLQKN
ncbi:5-methyltetrahydrofolate--homocysteine methyltransferase [Endomicrobiia bacterium]|uniref:homocysteine S-methyltransferase family protein n=1 Tax=Endomicrobium trichonymphae TaxID=1408204 RepID=UPI00086544FC|nr:homocysteine S-methyltransferase family protein [Candidatus Endomicrobium trichonymphae]BAV59127.1 homocysteine S-methyltransferase [Candidatus Endomicrobium trichonymphae]GHT23760.1 5-methyltetrahydrofolate--homocysteine methyltransferase [Endomicrobiia bacterium]